MLTIGSLFSGIGGLELGLEWAGLGPVLWQVERDEFCRRVLANHWPRAERFVDVRDVGAHNLERAELICGGFPCQDISVAGKGRGMGASRSGLWVEFVRVVDETQPFGVVVENIAAGSRWVEPVCLELERLGYDVLPLPLSAADVGAPHERSRIFVVGTNTNGDALRQFQQRHEGRRERLRNEGEAVPVDIGAHPGWQTLGQLHRGDDGVSSGLDDSRIERLGNAVVPQCAEVVGWVVREIAGLR